MTVGNCNYATSVLRIISFSCSAMARKLIWFGVEPLSSHKAMKLQTICLILNFESCVFLTELILYVMTVLMLQISNSNIMGLPRTMNQIEMILTVRYLDPRYNPFQLEFGIARSKRQCAFIHN